MAAEMYLQNASLWREVETMRSSLLRLRCELRVQSDVAKRLRQGVTRKKFVDRVNIVGDGEFLMIIQLIVITDHFCMIIVNE